MDGLSSQDYIHLLYEARQPISISELASRLGLKYNTVKFMVRPLEIMHCIERDGSMVWAVRENFDKCVSLLGGSDVLEPGEASYVVALLSDLHVGRKTPSFNVGILRERFRRYLDILTRIVSKHGGEVIVLGLGDYVDGADIYPRQEYEQELDPNEQVDVAFDITRELFEIANYFYGVVGNHGRTSESEPGNYDYLYLLHVKSLMGRNAGISKRHHEYYRLPNGDTVLLSHPPPPRIYSYQGIPDYGIRRFVSNHALANRELREAYFGHFHVPKVMYEAVPIYINGTFLSDDEFSKAMGFKSRPCQLVVIKSRLGNNIYVVEL